MTNEQLYIAIGIPMLFNVVLIGIRLAHVSARFDKIEIRLDAIDKRFDDMCDLWRVER